MIKIAICDDEKTITAELENALIKICKTLNVKCEIDVFYTGEDLCKCLEAGTNYDLIFLDIVFAKNKINGVEVGRQIRFVHKNDLVSIVFISWETEYSMQLFDVYPLNFLIKPLDYKKIEQVVKIYLKLARRWAQNFFYKTGYTTLKVQIKDIVFCESVKRKVVLHLKDGRKEAFYGTLKSIYQEQLQNFDFLFIHASYIVNYDYVATLKYDELLLTNNTSLPISQNKRKEISEACIAILERRTTG